MTIILTGAATGLAALLAAGVIALIRLSGLTQVIITEMRVRFDNNDDAHKDLRSDIKMLQERQRETESEIRGRLIADKWRSNYG
jgi:hypothetical protein